MAVLSDSDAAALANIAAFMNDDAAKARIAEMTAAKEDAEASLSRLKVQQVTNEKAQREAHDLFDAAIGRESANRQFKEELDRREAEMAKVSDALNAEKAAWEEVRQKVDAEQTAKAAQLGNAATTLRDRAALLTDLEQRARDLHLAAAAAKATYDKMIADLKAVIAQHESMVTPK